MSSPNPLWGAHVAVNRSLPASAGGHGLDPFLPQQRLDLTTILAAYTSGSARINGLDEVTGSIREGLDADFAVVDADLSEIADHEICQAEVTATLVRGQIAFQK